MQTEQIAQLRNLAIKVLQDAHKFPSEPNTSTVYSSSKYPDFTISVQNKSLSDEKTKYYIWFNYNYTSEYGTFNPSIRFRYTKEYGVMLMSTFIKHFNLDKLLPIYTEIVESYDYN